MMKAAIRERADELGFDGCRFTTSSPPDHGPHFQKWLAENRHGEMGYLERTAHKRVDPQRVLPGAKSIITLAASYAAGDESRLSISLPCASPCQGVESGVVAPAGQEVAGARLLASHRVETPCDLRLASTLAPPHACSADSRGQDSQHTPNPASDLRPPTSGFFARYARFTDYHLILGERLKELAGFVNGLAGGNTRSLWYVDTGPVLERDLAQRAGLGFIGKHTNLISRRLGNWIFLAEIITTLEVEPDAPEKNHCGSCARCLAACPTSAITAPFQLDARRCISYLTIELKGSIPVELRPALGNRIYGCDDCLAVCPWNRFAREGNLMKVHARAELVAPDLLELLKLDEAGFKRLFADTPILRTRRRGLLRNVCVALGNVGDTSVLPALQKAASDPEPLIAEHAGWAIDQIRARTEQVD